MNQVILVGSVLALVALGGCASSAPSAARGYEMRLRYAEITGVERVQMPSAVPAGAAVGGFTGLILSRNASSRSRVGAVAGGAALGGLATRALEGDRLGYGYTLRFMDGTTSRFITEKGYLRTGDCVVVEASQYVNVRRVAGTLCNNPVSAAIESNLLANAEQCEAAKTELLNASTNEAVEIAARKVEVLCGF